MLVNLADGSSAELDYPVVEGGTFIPYEATGFGDDFVLVGRLCADPDKLYNDTYAEDTCAPSTPAAFLLHGDGTWEEMALPDDVRSTQIANVPFFARSGDELVTAFHATDDHETGQIILRWSEGAWQTFHRRTRGQAFACATATHLYYLTSHTEGEVSVDSGVTTFAMARYALEDGKEEAVALPEMTSRFGGVTVRLGCNDVFPILTTSDIDGLQTVYAFTDGKWTTIEGILAGAELVHAADVLSHPRGIVVSAVLMEREPPSSRGRFFLVDEEMRVTELPADQLGGKVIRWAGDAPSLVLVQDMVGGDEQAPAEEPSSTTVRVMEI